MKSFKRRRDGQQSINAGSMADIAFLLLIFFLVTTTILFDEGIRVKLPPWAPNDEPIDVSSENVLSVLLNANNQLLVEQQPLQVTELRARTTQFLLHEASSPRKAVVSLQNDRSTQYETYLEVYNELMGAYRDIWEAQAQMRYQTAFDRLGLATQQLIRRDYPLVISEAEPKDLAHVE